MAVKTGNFLLPPLICDSGRGRTSSILGAEGFGAGRGCLAGGAGLGSWEDWEECRRWRFRRVRSWVYAGLASNAFQSSSLFRSRSMELLVC